MLDVLWRCFELRLHELLDLLHQLQCRVPWRNLPPEHHWLAVDTVQLIILIGVLKPRIFCFPTLL